MIVQILNFRYVAESVGRLVLDAVVDTDLYFKDVSKARPRYGPVHPALAVNGR